VADNIITISAPGTDVRSATGADVIFTTKYPFAKLDTTNDISFQTISILLNVEPSQPTALSTTRTLLYSFPHGYKYIPSIWADWQNTSPSTPKPPTPGNTATTYFSFGDDSNGIIIPLADNGTIVGAISPLARVDHNNSGTILEDVSDASLVFTADDTNVHIYLVKQSLTTVGGVPFPVNVEGYTLDIRCYVFVEDLGV
jgi:hypothetical protein